MTMLLCGIVRGSFQETVPRMTTENTVKHRNGGAGSTVVNHRNDGGESSIVVATLVANELSFNRWSIESIIDYDMP